MIFSLSFKKNDDIEKLGLCQSINKIAKAFNDGKVQSMLGEEDGTKDGVTIYDSKIDVEGLDDEFIADSETETVFFATFMSSSESKLKDKFAELKKQMVKCLGNEFETDKLEDLETITFTYSDNVTVELTIYYKDGEIDLNIDISKDE
jgi:hypothetical protein